MNQSDHDENIPVATLVESPKTRKNLGCILAVIAVLMSVLAIGLGGVWLLVSTIRNNDARIKAFKADPERLSNEIKAELETAKITIEKPSKLSSHPQHDRIVAFIDGLRPLLNDEANSNLQAKIDYELHLDEVLQRSASMSRSPFLRAFLRESLKQQMMGPASFESFEILRIEDDGNNRYRVYLNYSTGYDFSEPHCWWLSDRDQQIKLYDWCQLELGLRDSTETSILYDATDEQTAEYSEYVKHNNDYYEFSGEGFSSVESRRKTTAILTACEKFNGPAELLRSSQLTTARRWHYEDEYQRALALLENIGNPDLVPGVYSLTGEIQMERGNYDEAIQAYQNYLRVLGPMNHVQSQLAECYREMGDINAERETLSILTSASHQPDHRSFGQLMELNSPSQNLQLFSQIDQLDAPEEIYLGLVRFFSDSEYYSDRLELIHAHRQKTAPGSLSLVLATAELNPSLENRLALLNRIAEMGDPESESTQGLRYDFWYGLEENDLVELFAALAKAENLQEHFESLCEFDDGEDYFSDEALLRVCEITLKQVPESDLALLRQGMIQVRQKEFQSAIDSLKKFLEAMPEESEDKSLARHQLIAALYRSGDQAGAMELAEDEDEVVALLSLKTGRDHFSEFEKLLERLESDSEIHQYYTALLMNHRGDRDAAIERLAKLVNDANPDSLDYYEDYSNRHKLIELCEQDSDIARAFTLVPDSAMFEAVADRLIAKFDWKGCNALLHLAATAAEKMPTAQLRQRMNWNQGNYQQVVDQADEILALAQSEDASVELERLVKSALRIDNMDLATRIADSAAELNRQQDLVALVALRSKNAQRIAAACEPLKAWQMDSLESDSELMFTEWRSLISPDKRLPRDLKYYGAASLHFKLQLLFNEPLTLQTEGLLNRLKSVFGDQVQVESLADSGESAGSTWVVSVDGFQVFLTQDAVDGRKVSEGCENQQLKQAFSASNSRLSLAGFPLKPTTDQAVQEIVEAMIRCLASEHLQAVANYSQWLVKDQLTPWLSPSEGSKSLTLFSSEGLEGEWFYTDQTDNLPWNQSSETLRNLIAALKNKFEGSEGSQDSIVVTFRVQDDRPEKILARVERLQRSRYATVSLNVTILQDARFDPTIRQGDQVLILLDQVDQFEIQPKG